MTSGRSVVLVTASAIVGIAVVYWLLPTKVVHVPLKPGVTFDENTFEMDDLGRLTKLEAKPQLFRTPTLDGEKPTRPFVSFGALVKADRKLLEERTQNRIRDHENRLRDYYALTSSVEVSGKIADSMFMLELERARLAALAAGEAFYLDGSLPFKRDDPRYHVSTWHGLETWFSKETGMPRRDMPDSYDRELKDEWAEWLTENRGDCVRKDVVVAFVFDLDRHDGLRGARANYKAMNSEVILDRIRTFNGLPLEVRQERVAESSAAKTEFNRLTDRMREIEAIENRSQAMDKEWLRLRDEQDRLRGKFLSVQVDPNTHFAVPPRRRRK